MAHILVVDSDPLMRNVAHDVFSRDGHDVVCVDASEVALAHIEHKRPQVIVLDLHSGAAQGDAPSFLDMVRSDPVLRTIPLLLITGVYRDLDDAMGLSLPGGHDFLTKPFDARELRARTYALLKLSSSVETLMTDLADPETDYWRMSITDPLTGAYNKPYFEHRFAIEQDRGRRTGEILGLLAVDIASLNDINRELGREAGDAVLRHVAEAIRRRLRYTDILCRYDGDEFMALLFNIQPTVLPRIARDIHRTISENLTPFGDGGIETPVSIGGIVIHPNDPDAWTTLIDRTRRALGAAADDPTGVVIQTLPGELVPDSPAGDDDPSTRFDN